MQAAFRDAACSAAALAFLAVLLDAHLDADLGARPGFAGAERF
jgi:hypothetical protein